MCPYFYEKYKITEMTPVSLLLHEKKKKMYNNRNCKNNRKYTYLISRLYTKKGRYSSIVDKNAIFMGPK